MPLDEMRIPARRVSSRFTGTSTPTRMGLFSPVGLTLLHARLLPHAGSRYTIHFPTTGIRLSAIEMANDIMMARKLVTGTARIGLNVIELIPTW